MVSIILVGKNEGYRLEKSLSSVYILIELYKEIDFDIIYVDSKSTDNSIEIVKRFPLTRIFEITGETNSAIARNIGANEAYGDILFFVDADMEIQPEFLKYVFTVDGNLKNNYITGHLDDYFYTADGKFIGCSPRTYNVNIPIVVQELNQNGGLCLINKSTWELIGGMRNKYRRSQDLDLTIRLKKNGIKILRFPYLAAKHHTVDYNNEKRMWIDLWKGNNLYPGLIFRDHFFNFDVIKRVARSNYTAVLLLLGLISIPFAFNWLVSILYIVILFTKVFIQSKNAKSNQIKLLYFIERIPFQFLMDISFWSGFFFFFPKGYKSQYTNLSN